MVKTSMKRTGMAGCLYSLHMSLRGREVIMFLSQGGLKDRTSMVVEVS